MTKCPRCGDVIADSKIHLQNTGCSGVPYPGQLANPDEMCGCCKEVKMQPGDPLHKCENCSKEEVKHWCPGCFQNPCMCRKAQPAESQPQKEMGCPKCRYPSSAVGRALHANELEACKRGFEHGEAYAKNQARSIRDAEVKELVEALEKILAGPKPGDDCEVYYRNRWIDLIAEQSLEKFQKEKP